MADGLDLVVIGAASRDVAGDDLRGWRLGGAATYCSLAAARLGLRVGCLLGVDQKALDEADGEIEMLALADVRLSLVPLGQGPVFENIERDGHRRQRWLSKSDQIMVGALPDEWRSAPAWLLAPVAAELGEEWAAAIPAGSAIGLSWQGLLREFGDDGWVKRAQPQRSALLEAAGLVVASVHDLAGNAEFARLRTLAANAAIVLTAGDGGGVALQCGRLLRYRAAPAERVVDATGAGDVFLAALMTAWILTGDLATPETLRFAAAAGSCAVEGIGLSGVPTRSLVAARLRAPTPEN
jgi:sugar/nucleoside kinase (ribokinase family)